MVHNKEMVDGFIYGCETQKRHARPITLLIIKKQAQVSKQLSTCYLHFYGTKTAAQIQGPCSRLSMLLLLCYFIFTVKVFSRLSMLDLVVQFFNIV